MNTIQLLVYSLFSLFLLPAGFAQEATEEPQKGILVLGSANKETSEARVRVALRLYGSQDDFDYIVVSGGCGAHSSSICEASLMADLLMENGVPAEKIYKEEKSKSTVQNYCYSRRLENADGSKVIEKGDLLFVVSDHWHAMSVAARFAKYDEVDARYFIEGNIRPRQKDKLDYTNIFDNGMDSDAFCLSALWNVVEASYSLEGKRKEEQPFAYIGTGKFQGAGESEEWLPAASPEGEEPSFDGNREVDAAYYNDRENRLYLFEGSHYVSFKPNKGKKSVKEGEISELFKDLPLPWNKGAFDAAFLNSNDNLLYLFKGEYYIKLDPRKGKLQSEPLKIVELVSNWPFQWGSGELDAARYQQDGNKLVLFRGQEYLEISLSGTPVVDEGFPKKNKVAKPEK